MELARADLRQRCSSPPRARSAEGAKLQAIAPTEIFFTYLQCALLAGFILALPVFFWQAWAFVAPGLYPKEKKVALPFVLVSTSLFLAGGWFGHTVVFPVIFSFFASFSSSFVEAAWTMHEVFGFSTRMLLAFGTGFELPVIVFFLAFAGIVEPRRMLGGHEVLRADRLHRGRRAAPRRTRSRRACSRAR